MEADVDDRAEAEFEMCDDVAGFVKGDRIVGVNGVQVRTQEQFYEAMWRGRAGDTIEVAVRRHDAVRIIPVRSIDRSTLYRTSQ